MARALGSFYSTLDDRATASSEGGRLVTVRDARVVRGLDEGASGPDEPIDEAIHLWQQVLNPHVKDTKGW